MNLDQISRFRLYHQQVSHPGTGEAKNLVAWMGAMQAQDYTMCKWAIGVRIPGSTGKTIQQSIDAGEIIRTHILRPTWHLVSEKDVGWMLDLTAPQIRASLTSRHRELEITPPILKKSFKVMEKSLAEDHHLTRESLAGALEKNKIATGNQRLAHLLLCAEIDKVICSGPFYEKKATYALFTERVRTDMKLSREEAAAKLVTTYLKSHGPATLQDFIWWSGLPATDARRSLEMVKKKFESQKISAQTYWFTPSSNFSPVKTPAVYFLPAFDEFIISYKDRSACLPEKKRRSVVSSNGVFWPVIVINGKVAGLWRRTMAKNKVVIGTEFFEKNTLRKNKDLQMMVDEASGKVRAFYEQ